MLIPSYLGGLLWQNKLISGQHCLSDTKYKTQPTSEAIKILTSEASRMTILQSTSEILRDRQTDHSVEISKHLSKISQKKLQINGKDEPCHSATLPY